MAKLGYKLDLQTDSLPNALRRPVTVEMTDVNKKIDRAFVFNGSHLFIYAVK